MQYVYIETILDVFNFKIEVIRLRKLQVKAFSSKPVSLLRHMHRLIWFNLFAMIFVYYNNV